MQWVLLMFIEGRFVPNHLYTRLKALIILFYKSFEFEPLTNILVSSANNMGEVLSFTVSGKSLM
jgi:hypothetical protein